MMKTLKKIILLTFFALLGINVSAQKAEANFVFIKDKSLIKTIKMVMNENDFCNKGLWIIQINRKGKFDLTKGQTYFEEEKDSEKTKTKEQYVTTIEDELFFIFTESRFSALFEITSFKMDIKPLIDTEFVPFAQFSYWKILKEDGSYSVVKEYIHKCK